MLTNNSLHTDLVRGSTLRGTGDKIAGVRNGTRKQALVGF